MVLIAGKTSFYFFNIVYDLKNSSYRLSVSLPYLSNQNIKMPKTLVLFSISNLELNVTNFG